MLKQTLARSNRRRDHDINTQGLPARRVQQQGSHELATPFTNRWNNTQANKYKFETDSVDEQVEVPRFPESQRDETTRDLQSILNKNHVTQLDVDHREAASNNQPTD